MKTHVRNREIWILGAGGHGRVLLDLLQRADFKVGGFVDPDSKAVAQIPISAELPKADPLRIILVNALGSVHAQGLEKRKSVFDSYKAKGFEFLSCEDKTASLAMRVELHEGVQLLMGSCVQTGVSIGRNTILNTRASVDHDCRIGEHCHIAPGATLSGGVTVGDMVHIGVGATVMQGIKIGSGATIGAGAVVVQDVPAGKMAKGVPARYEGE